MRIACFSKELKICSVQLDIDRLQSDLLTKCFDSNKIKELLQYDYLLFELSIPIATSNIPLLIPGEDSQKQEINPAYIEDINKFTEILQQFINQYKRIYFVAPHSDILQIWSVFQEFIGSFETYQTAEKYFQHTAVSSLPTIFPNTINIHSSVDATSEIQLIPRSKRDKQNTSDQPSRQLDESKNSVLATVIPNESKSSGHATAIPQADNPVSKSSVPASHATPLPGKPKTGQSSNTILPQADNPASKSSVPASHTTPLPGKPKTGQSSNTILPQADNPVSKSSVPASHATPLPGKPKTGQSSNTILPQADNPVSKSSVPASHTTPLPGKPKTGQSSNTILPRENNTASNPSLISNSSHTNTLPEIILQAPATSGSNANIFDQPTVIVGKPLICETHHDLKEENLITIPDEQSDDNDDVFNLNQLEIFLNPDTEEILLNPNAHDKNSPSQSGGDTADAILLEETSNEPVQAEAVAMETVEAILAEAIPVDSQDSNEAQPTDICFEDEVLKRLQISHDCLEEYIKNGKIQIVRRGNAESYEFSRAKIIQLQNEQASGNTMIFEQQSRQSRTIPILTNTTMDAPKMPSDVFDALKEDNFFGKIIQTWMSSSKLATSGTPIQATPTTLAPTPTNNYATTPATSAISVTNRYATTPAVSSTTATTNNHTSSLATSTTTTTSTTNTNNYTPPLTTSSTSSTSDSARTQRMPTQKNADLGKITSSIPPTSINFGHGIADITESIHEIPNAIESISNSEQNSADDLSKDIPANLNTQSFICPPDSAEDVEPLEQTEIRPKPDLSRDPKICGRETQLNLPVAKELAIPATSNMNKFLVMIIIFLVGPIGAVTYLIYLNHKQNPVFIPAYFQAIQYPQSYQSTAVLTTQTTTQLAPDSDLVLEKILVQESQPAKKGTILSEFCRPTEVWYEIQKLNQELIGIQQKIKSSTLKTAKNELERRQASLIQTIKNKKSQLQTVAFPAPENLICSKWLVSLKNPVISSRQGLYQYQNFCSTIFFTIPIKHACIFQENSIANLVCNQTNISATMTAMDSLNDVAQIKMILNKAELQELFPQNQLSVTWPYEIKQAGYLIAQHAVQQDEQGNYLVIWQGKQCFVKKRIDILATTEQGVVIQGDLKQHDIAVLDISQIADYSILDN